MNTENTVQKQYSHLAPHQFAPGISGNPNGRPRGSRNMSTVFREALDVLAQNESAVDGWETIEQQMVRAQIKKALCGDTRAFEAVMDRAYGKPKQVVEIDSNDSGGVAIDEAVAALAEVLGRGSREGENDTINNEFSRRELFRSS